MIESEELSIQSIDITPKQLKDDEEASNLAIKIMKKYDRNGEGELNSKEVCNILIDAYRGIKRRIDPSKQEVASFEKALKRTNGEKVNLGDFNSLVSDYLSSNASTIKEVKPFEKRVIKYPTGYNINSSTFNF